MPLLDNKEIVARMQGGADAAIELLMEHKKIVEAINAKTEDTKIGLIGVGTFFGFLEHLRYFSSSMQDTPYKIHTAYFAFIVDLIQGHKPILIDNMEKKVREVWSYDRTICYQFCAENGLKEGPAKFHLPELDYMDYTSPFGTYKEE